jgi:hypothetical protein
MVSRRTLGLVKLTKSYAIMIYSVIDYYELYETKIIKRNFEAENKIETVEIFRDDNVAELIFRTINYLLENDEGVDVIQIKKFKIKLLSEK